MGVRRDILRRDRSRGSKMVNGDGRVGRWCTGVVSGKLEFAGNLWNLRWEEGEAGVAEEMTLQKDPKRRNIK
jgi:hypothetical protein